MKNKIILIILAVITVAAFLFVSPIKNEIIYFYHFQKGNFSDEQKQAMEKTRSGDPVNFVAEKDGKEYILPLPDGATEYPDGGYIVINYEFFDKYYEKIQNLDGYKFDQMGNLIILKSNDGEITFCIMMTNIARRYEGLEVTYG